MQKNQAQVRFVQKKTPAAFRGVERGSGQSNCADCLPITCRLLTSCVPIAAQLCLQPAAGLLLTDSKTPVPSAMTQTGVGQ